MNLSPDITEQFNGMIWRMEVDPVSGTLFAEVRNEQEKQVGFASVNLASGKVNFQNLVTGERWLTGIEAAYNGVLLLHNYQSAGSPAHKGIIAVNGETGAILWSSYNCAFDHMCATGPVLFDTRIQPRKLFTADIKTGEALHAYNSAIDLAIDAGIVIPDRISPELLTIDALPEQPFGNIVHNLYYNCYRIVSLHALKEDRLDQRLYIFEDDRQVFSDLLNTGIQKLQPEAFVLHNNHLIYLKNRNELNVINL